MRCLVTGAGGFIGSRLTGQLLERGDEVVGIDCFADYYPRWMKERNLEGFAGHEMFRLVEEDLVETDLAALLSGIDVCFHLAAQAGVRKSWGKEFSVYTRNNILATQMLFDAAAKTSLKRLVFASSSSVYGDAELPFQETSRCRPVSPYGLTKFACEHLARLYFTNFGLPVVSLRYFTVYGPGQRPDMAFHRFILWVTKDEPIAVYGDGNQTRDFTFVDDAVEATMRAGDPDRNVNGSTMNIAGGSVVKLKETIELLGKLLGKEPRIERSSFQRGDARHTAADISHAQELLDYAPKWTLEEGLKAEINGIERLYSKE
ncbi:NAD-dependent epimerase/dehydratase family protein [Acidobacteriota bacterium]